MHLPKAVYTSRTYTVFVVARDEKDEHVTKQTTFLQTSLSSSRTCICMHSNFQKHYETHLFYYYYFRQVPKHYTYTYFFCETNPTMFCFVTFWRFLSEPNSLPPASRRLLRRYAELLGLLGKSNILAKHVTFDKGIFHLF